MKKELPAGDAIVQQLYWRYATKAYDAGKTIPDADWQTLQSALELAPSSFGLQPYKFIVVENKEIREKLRNAAYGQSQVTDASHLVVFAYKKTLNDSDVEKFVERIGNGWGQTRQQLAAYEDTMKGAAKKAVDNGHIETWNSRQAYIALGFLLETAALLGIDATPMEGFDADQFNEILGLEDHSAAVICALGYRDAENDWLASLPKVRRTRQDVVEVV